MVKPDESAPVATYIIWFSSDTPGCTLEIPDCDSDDPDCMPSSPNRKDQVVSKMVKPADESAPVATYMIW